MAPEHREEVAQHLLIGQSLYLDAHINPAGNPWHIDSSGSTPAARLAANLASALAASDGIVPAIRRAKDPAGFARNLFTTKTPRTNLLRNGDFTKAEAKGGAPDGWFTWQADGSHGAIAWTDGRLTISNAGEAVPGFIAETKPGTLLAARLRVKSTSRGQGALAIGWKASDGKWTAQAHNAKFFPTGPIDTEGCREITGLVEVPSGAGQIVFMPSAAAQLTASDGCDFDDAERVSVPVKVKTK